MEIADEESSHPEMKVGNIEIKILWTEPDVDSRVLIKFAWLTHSLLEILPKNTFWS